jgi:four helix bundle protein
MQNAEGGKKDLVERTYQFARRIIRFYQALEKSADGKVLGLQVLRSGTSVGANYREANRGRSKAEFRAKVGECLKEADETDFWLNLLCDEGYMDRESLQPLINE